MAMESRSVSPAEALQGRGISRVAGGRGHAYPLSRHSTSVAVRNDVPAVVTSSEGLGEGVSSATAGPAVALAA